MAAIEPWNWTEADVTALLNSCPESLTLDYKRSQALDMSDKSIRELSKDVSAFANTIGGTLLYGFHESQQLATSFDDGVDSRLVTRERIENILLSNIQPRLLSLRVRSIPVSSLGEGRTIFIVHVEESHTIHQAKDLKYYRRFDTKVEPMFDHEIRAKLDRGRKPIVRARLIIEPGIVHENKKMFVVKVDLKNEGRVRAQSGKLELWLPSRSVARVGSDFTCSTQRNCPFSENLRYLACHKITHHFSQTIFPQDVLELNADGQLIQLAMDVNDPTWQRGRLEYAFWRVFVDDALPVQEDLELGNDHIVW